MPHAAPDPPPAAQRQEPPALGPGARLRAAFSLRNNLRLMLVAPAGHLRPLDGLRALSILWVLLFHAGWSARFVVSDEIWQSLVFARWMLPVWRGDFGVDVFFVLSGFLIATMLLDELAATGRLALGRFYARRLLRLWPALLLALLADVLLIEPYPRMAWANALYVSNFVSVARVSMGWTWSLSLEEQFYLVCPWLLRALWRRPTRQQAALTLALCASLMAFTAALVVHFRLRPLDAEIVTNTNLSHWTLAFDVLYDKPWTRGGALLVGVASAMLYRSQRLMAALAAARLGGLGLLLLALATMAAATHWQLVIGARRAVEIAYLASFRTAFAAGTACVMLLSLSQHPAGRLLGRALSWRLLYPIAQLAYGAYLVNPIVCDLVNRALGPRALSAAGAMLLFMPADLALTLGIAAALHLLVERPFMQLRPRSR